MSKNIFESNNLKVTAFVGINGQSCVQITIDNADYEQLNEMKTRELRDALTKMLQRRKGFRATDLKRIARWNDGNTN